MKPIGRLIPLFLSALFFLFCRVPSTAQDGIAGDWTIVDSVVIDISTVSGTAYIENHGLYYGFSWKARHAGDVGRGIGLKRGEHFFVGGATGESDVYGIVIYDVNDNGMLKGEWTSSGLLGGDGEEHLGSEIATGGNLTDQQSTYAVSGTNPDGTDYSGSLQVTRISGRYGLRWDIAGQITFGIGIRVGGQLVVGWGWGESETGLFVASYSFGEDRAEGYGRVAGQASFTPELLVRRRMVTPGR